MTSDMTTGSPTKHILFFSIPILIGNVFQQLYNMVDTIIVGKCINTKALAAVGLTGPLSFLVLGFMIGITSGFGVIVAQYFGAKDEKSLRNSIATSIVLCTIITVILTTLALLFTSSLLNIMNTPDDVYEDAKTYIAIIFMGIACSMLYNMVACVLRALGDSKTPLYFLILSSVLNIILDLGFILLFNMGVAGAALATIISQGVSGILSLLYAKQKYKILTLHREDFSITTAAIRKHLALGLPMALQFSITAIGVIILQSALNLFGSIKIAAFTAASKVEQIVSSPAGTFGASVATYTGQNHGAHNYKRIRSGVRSSLILTLICSVIASMIVFFLGESLTGLFVQGSQPEVIESAQLYLNMLAIFFPFLNILFIYRNVLQGVGRSFVPLLAGVAELIMRALVAFTLPSRIGFLGVCLASPIAWVGACIPLIPTYYILIHQLNKHSN